MILNSMEGMFYLFYPGFDGDVPDATGDGSASLHTATDILMVETWSEWADIDVDAAIVTAEPSVDEGVWEVVSRAEWYVAGPAVLTDMEFDPGDRTKTLPLEHSRYEVLWCARTADFARSHGVDLTTGAREEHKIFVWRP